VTFITNVLFPSVPWLGDRLASCSNYLQRFSFERCSPTQ